MKLNIKNEENTNNDWTTNWEELFYGSAIRFLEENKKYLVVGFNEDNDFRELFLDEKPDDNFLLNARDLDGYKAVAIFKRNKNNKDFENPRNSVTYINSFYNQS